MFGMGFFEIVMIAVVAVIALGPEKLPSAMVDIARFMKKVKKGIDDAKETIEQELTITELKEEARKFKAQIEDVKAYASIDEDDLNIKDILGDDLEEVSKKSSPKKIAKKAPAKTRKKATKPKELKEVEKNTEKSISNVAKKVTNKTKTAEKNVKSKVSVKKDEKDEKDANEDKFRVKTKKVPSMNTRKNQKKDEK